jgi:hypothetical protein
MVLDCYSHFPQPLLLLDLFKAISRYKDQAILCSKFMTIEPNDSTGQQQKLRAKMNLLDQA